MLYLSIVSMQHQPVSAHVCGLIRVCIAEYFGHKAMLHFDNNVAHITEGFCILDGQATKIWNEICELAKVK